jgi:hypothetical protein
MNDPSAANIVSAPAHLIDSAPDHPVNPSAWRAWWSLVALSVRRQARAHLLVWIAFTLLALSVFVVALGTQDGQWEGHRGFAHFSFWIVIALFCGFLMPLWTLSFATEALGREREAGNLVWVLTRPLSRPAIYLGKLLAALPWVLGFNLVGFAVICAVAGPPGFRALGLYWPAVVVGSVTYAALFHLMGAWFRRAAVVAVVYAFFIESFMGRMPGYWKRISVSFYTKCLVFASGADQGVEPRNPTTYLAVTAPTALCVLATATALFLAWGVIVFTSSEYLDLS